MAITLNDAINKEIWSVTIRYDSREYLTLSYYTASDEVLLHDEESVIYFEDDVQLQKFCAKNELQLSDDRFHYDFDASIENPVRYSDVLDRWNMLNSIAGMFRMYFEGDRFEYNGLYDLLFRLSTSAVPIPPEEWLSKRHMRLLERVFRRKHRYLTRFRLWQVRTK